MSEVPGKRLINKSKKMGKRNEPVLSKPRKIIVGIIGVVVGGGHIYLFIMLLYMLFGLFFFRKTNYVSSHTQKESVERGAFLFKYKPLPNYSKRLSYEWQSFDAYAEKGYYYNNKLAAVRTIAFYPDRSRVYISFYSSEPVECSLEREECTHHGSCKDNIVSLKGDYFTSLPPDTINIIISNLSKDKQDTVYLVRENSN